MGQLGEWRKSTAGVYEDGGAPTPPEGTLYIVVFIRGGGGAGRLGGGGGGAHARTTYNWPQGSKLTAVVGQGGSQDHGGSSSLSCEIGGIICMAPGGEKAGGDEEKIGGPGAAANTCTGDICHSGGRGGDWHAPIVNRGAGGGGGGSGYPVADGGNGSDDTPGGYGGGHGGSNEAAIVSPYAGDEGGGGGGHFLYANGGARGGDGDVWVRFYN